MQAKSTALPTLPGTTDESVVIVPIANGVELVVDRRVASEPGDHQLRHLREELFGREQVLRNVRLTIRSLIDKVADEDQLYDHMLLILEATGLTPVHDDLSAASLAGAIDAVLDALEANDLVGVKDIAECELRKSWGIDEQLRRSEIDSAAAGGELDGPAEHWDEDRRWEELGRKLAVRHPAKFDAALSALQAFATSDGSPIAEAELEGRLLALHAPAAVQ